MPNLEKSMVRILIAGLILISFFSTKVSAQNNSILQLEGGIEREERELSYGLGLIYQYQGLQFKIKASQDFLLIGNPNYNQLRDSPLSISYVERYKYKFIGSISWKANFQFLTPLFGIGVSYRPDVTNIPNRIKKNEFSLYSSVGIQIDQFYIAYNASFRPWKNWNGSGYFELGYRQGITKKQSPAKREYFLFNQERSLQQLRSRIFFGSSINIPLSKRFNGGTKEYYIGFNKLFKNFLVGIEYGFRRNRSMGSDSEYINEEFVNASGELINGIRFNTNSRISNTLALYYRRITKELKNKQFEYGGGIKYFKTHSTYAYFGFFPSDYLEEQKLIGLIIQGKLRYGNFSNGIDINIPFGEFKPYVSFSWYVGLNFRRKGGILGHLNEAFRKD